MAGLAPIEFLERTIIVSSRKISYKSVFLGFLDAAADHLAIDDRGNESGRFKTSCE